MRLKIKLEGFPEAILNEMIAKGIAKNKTRAIEMVLLHYGKHLGIREAVHYTSIHKGSNHL